MRGNESLSLFVIRQQQNNNNNASQSSPGRGQSMNSIWSTYMRAQMGRCAASKKETLLRRCGSMIVLEELRIELRTFRIHVCMLSERSTN